MATQTTLTIPGNWTKVDVYDELSITRGAAIQIKNVTPHDMVIKLYSGVTSSTTDYTKWTSMVPGEIYAAADENYVEVWCEGPEYALLAVEA